MRKLLQPVFSAVLDSSSLLLTVVSPFDYLTSIVHITDQRVLVIFYCPIRTKVIPQGCSIFIRDGSPAFTQSEVRIMVKLQHSNYEWLPLLAYVSSSIFCCNCTLLLIVNITFFFLYLLFWVQKVMVQDHLFSRITQILQEQRGWELPSIP